MGTHSKTFSEKYLDNLPGDARKILKIALLILAAWVSLVVLALGLVLLGAFVHSGEIVVFGVVAAGLLNDPLHAASLLWGMLYRYWSTSPTGVYVYWRCSLAGNQA